MTRKVCIITPGTIASNPRMVKEASALSQAGYHVHLVYTRHVNYLVETDQDILNQHPEWTVDYLDWCGKGLKPRAIKYLSGVKHKVANFLLKKGWYQTDNFPSLFNRFYSWQLKKAIASKADLYIAHYPESIGVAAHAAEINSSVFAYDAEDYHRGEDLPSDVISWIRLIEDSLLPFAKYMTAASPLIAVAYKKLFQGVPVTTIENMFLIENQPVYRVPTEKDCSFFWFSQTVGPKRGLEEFINILGNFKKQSVRLTLLGNVSAMFKTELTRLWAEQALDPSKLVFIDTVPEKEIFKLAAEHHFGLCLEKPLVPNKEFCLSNKLYTYILSGNLIIFSETQAQKKFHQDFPETGMMINLKDSTTSAEQIKNIIADLSLINQKRRANYDLGRSTLNFDKEKEALLKQVAALWD